MLRSRTLLTLSLILAALFLLSTRFTLGLRFGEFHAAILESGAACLIRAHVSYTRPEESPLHLGPLFLDRTDLPITWLHRTQLGGEYDLDALSLFPLTLLTLAAALILRARSRAKGAHCPKCDYSFAGLPPNTPCPECGTPRLSSPEG